MKLSHGVTTDVTIKNPKKKSNCSKLDSSFSVAMLLRIFLHMRTAWIFVRWCCVKRQHVSLSLRFVFCAPTPKLHLLRLNCNPTEMSSWQWSVNQVTPTSEEQAGNDLACVPRHQLTQLHCAVCARCCIPQLRACAWGETSVKSPASQGYLQKSLKKSNCLVGGKHIRDLTHRVRYNANFSRIETFRFFGDLDCATTT